MLLLEINISKLHQLPCNEASFFKAVDKNIPTLF